MFPFFSLQYSTGIHIFLFLWYWMSNCWTYGSLPCHWPRDILGFSPVTGQEVFCASSLPLAKRPSGLFPCQMSRGLLDLFPATGRPREPLHCPPLMPCCIQPSRSTDLVNAAGGNGVTLSRELSEQTFVPDVLSLCPGEERWLV